VLILCERKCRHLKWELESTNFSKFNYTFKNREEEEKITGVKRTKSCLKFEMHLHESLASSDEMAEV
jgi:hypothetical protein